MLNQKIEMEDFSAARYIEDYLDCMENLPNELQRHLTRMLDFDATGQKYFHLYEQYEMMLASNLDDELVRRYTLAQIQKTLIIIQDIGDEKLQIMQTIQDLIERKARQLDIDYKNLKPNIEQENNECISIADSSINSSNNNKNKNNNERINRRQTKAKVSVTAETNQTADASVLSENQSSNLPSTSSGAQRRINNTNSRGKKKRRSNASQRNQIQQIDDPPDEDDPTIDPDEPRYCLCHNISYGKMIMCDNDSCEKEWFHFKCVNLTVKPKGNWYCPECRGSKSSIMKVKKQIR